MNDEELRQTTSLEVQTDRESLTVVWQWFEQFSQTLIGDTIQWQCKLALTEGLTNVIDHAHKSLPETTPIELELKMFTHKLEIRIWDRGGPFNFKHKLHWILRAGLIPVDDEHHRGLFLMYKLMDEVYYTRLQDQRNCLLLIKRLK
jgi:serine/threonine-protein kinase RsbW